MIKNHKLIEKFEKNLIKTEKIDITRNFQIIDALYFEAVELGIFPLKNPLDGIDNDIRIAKVINSV